MAGHPPNDLSFAPERYVWAVRFGRIAVSLMAVVFVLGWIGGMFQPISVVVGGCGFGVYVLTTRWILRNVLTSEQPERVALVGILTAAVLMAAGVYVTSGASSPLIVLYGPMAAFVGIYLPFRYAALASAASATALGVVTVLELTGTLPHIPLFRDGTDPGLAQSLPWVIVTVAGVFVKMCTIAFGCDYLTRKLREREAELRAAETGRIAELERFSAVVAHEVRNPLAGIRGAASLIDRLDASPDARRMAGIIRDEIDRLDHLTTQYLRFGRPSQPNPQLVQLRDLVQRTIAVLGSNADGVAPISTVEEGDLPMVRADPDQFHEVLLNLIMNAREAAGPTGEVRVTTHAVADGVECAVSDSGDGIKPENLPRLFDPFFTTRSRGSGLGLSVVRRIVEAHGGTVSAANGPIGAVFTVKLRRA